VCSPVPRWSPVASLGSNKKSGVATDQACTDIRHSAAVNVLTPPDFLVLSEIRFGADAHLDGGQT